MRQSFLLTCFIILLAACSETEHITSGDQKYIFFAADIEHFPIEAYQHKKTPEQMPYILFKSYTRQSGFRGLYGTILVRPDGGEVKYLCLVNILPTVGQARGLFDRMTPEPSPTIFGEEEAVDPAHYHADEAFLYRDDSYFHLVLLSNRVVYTILLEGAHVEERQVKNALRKKLDYVKHHADTIR